MLYKYQIKVTLVQLSMFVIDLLQYIYVMSNFLVTKVAKLVSLIDIYSIDIVLQNKEMDIFKNSKIN